MLNEKINLTQLCAFKEIQSILQESNEYHDNTILKDPVYQQQIFKYVLANLSHRYMVLENVTEIPQSASDIFPECPIDERIAIRQLLQMGMSKIVRSLLEQSEQGANKMTLEELR